jgi:hypothetical protein
VQSVTFNGEGITAIGEGAFYGCANLSYVNIPDSVIEVKAYAFTNCSALQTLNLVNVLTVGDYAFYNAGLTSVTLDKAETIGNFAFATQSETNADEAVGKFISVQNW